LAAFAYVVDAGHAFQKSNDQNLWMVLGGVT